MREGRRLPCSWSLPLQASAFKFLPEIRRCHSQQVPLQHRMLREAELLNSGGLNLTVGHCGSVWCFKGILGAANRNWRRKRIKSIKPVNKAGERGHHLMEVKLTTHRPLRYTPCWLRDAFAHMGGAWDIPNMDSEPGKSKWLAKGNLEKMPHLSDLKYHKGTTVSVWVSLCVYPHVLYSFSSS